MNLMSLGQRSRKTGITPKENLRKDKFDMEDLDEFFSDASWTASKQSAPFDVNKRRANATFGTDTREDMKQRPFTFENTNSLAKLSSASVSPDKTNETQHAVTESMNNSKHVDFQDMDHNNNHSENLHEEGFLDNFGEISEDSSSHSPRSEKSGQGLTARYKNTEYNRSMPAKKKDVARIMKSIATKSSKNVIELDNQLEEISVEFSPLSKMKDSSDIFNDDMNLKPELASSHMSHTESLKNTLPSPPPEELRRSKRTKIAPLAYWRNERVIYSKADRSNTEIDSTLIHDIHKIPLQEIAEVVHVPETQGLDGHRKKNKRSRKKNSEHPNKNVEKYDYESDPEIEGSEWFKNKSLKVDIFESNEKMSRKTIAWAPSGGDFQLPQTAQNGSSTMENFKVASLFDPELASVAAGLLDFPPEGHKSLRTAGESSFIFHVARGLIEVTLNSTKFVVTKGCSFEVPKYNVYSFRNLGRGHARLFFVQMQIS